MSNTLNLTRDEIYNLLEREGISASARYILDKVLDRAFATPAVTDNEARFVEEIRKTYTHRGVYGQGKIPAIKMARTLRPWLGFGEAKNLVERILDIR